MICASLAAYAALATTDPSTAKSHLWLSSI
jgi:hypothetical protein